MATQTQKGSGTLTTMFIAAATAVVTGIPTDFISEFFIFPFYHNSTLGGEVVNISSSLLLPLYESVGEWLGFPSVLNSGVDAVPDVSF